MSAATTSTRRGAKATRAAEPAPAPTAAYPATREQEIAWLEFLENVLDHAANTDEAGSWSGDSDRLLRVASEVAGRLSANPADAGDCNTVVNRAYTIASVIKAALQVPGDTPSAERLAFIEQAWVPLIGLTGDPTVRDGWETYPRTLATAAPPSPAPAPARPRDFLGDIQAKVGEALAVLQSLAEDSGDEPIWGLVRLAEWAADEVQARADEERISKATFGACAADIACVLSILHLVAEHDDLVLIHAAGSLLEMAASYCESAQEIGHA